MAAETPIGSIVGFLRLDADQFHRELMQAITELETLEGKRADVKIDVDTSNAERALDRVGSSSRRAATGLDAMSASSRRLTDAADRVRLAELKLAEVHERKGSKASQIAAAEQALTRAMRAHQDAVFDTYSANLDLVDSSDEVVRSNERVDRSSRQASRGMGALVTAVIALGPALVPIAAGAVGLGIGFAGMGVAAVAALTGINKEMAKGTTVGLNYAAGLHDAQDAWAGLEKVAARNVLGSFQKVIEQLNDSTPRLTHQVGDLSTMTGKAGANLAGGLLSAFLALDPLMRDAGVYVVGLTRRFDEAMSGGGVVAFGDYVRSVLPEVVGTIEDVVVAAVHLVEGFAPLGMGTLSLLRLFADAINAIPVEVLQQLAPLATGAFLGFRLWSGLSGMVSGFGTALEKVGVSAERAAVGMRVLNVATGIIGAAVAVLSVIFTANAESQRRAEQAANDYADALRQSHGAIDQNIRDMTAKRLADDGALEAARMLGISLPTITDAALGEADAMKVVTDAIEKNSRTKRSSTSANGIVVSNSNKAADAADTLTKSLGLTNAALDAGQQKYRDQAAASAASTTVLSNEAVVVSTLAARYGMSVTTYNAVKGAAQQQAQAHANATAKMQLENDAAGLLKQSLDALAGKSLSTAQAQNGFDRAIVGLTQSTRNAKGQIDKAKTSLSGMGDAAVTNRGNLLNLATQANNVATATANQTGSTEKGRQKLIAMRDQIIKTAVAQGMNRDEVQKFIDTVLKVPTHVPPTKADADTSAAKRKMSDLRADIRETMRDRTANMFISVSSNVRSAVAGVQAAVAAIGASIGRRHGGKIPGYAGGGKLRGPGTGTSDSIMAYVRETGRPIALSTDEYVSTAASTARNEAALEAGNRGATLGVVDGPGGGGSGLTELGDATLQRLAEILATMPREIHGTLDTPFGPAEVRGVVDARLSEAALEVSRGVRR